jgi:hypothetical protein
MKFRDWIVLIESIDPQQIINAALVARKQGNCDRVHFSACKAILEETLAILMRAGISARISSGTFTTKKNESWDHSWIVVGKWILDPTVDQFKTDSAIKTKSPGIYYSHPSWDGNHLRERYFHSKPIAKINL